MSATTSQYLLIILPMLILVLVGWNVFLHLRFLAIKKKLKFLFNGTKATDLEGVLFETIKRQKNVEENIKEINKICDNLNRMAEKSLQKVGVVRYNPFKDTGGDQSFVIALLDKNNNGATISSLYTREGTRIYSKPIVNGVSKYPLTQEENQAIKQACK